MSQRFAFVPFWSKVNAVSRWGSFGSLGLTGLFFFFFFFFWRERMHYTFIIITSRKENEKPQQTAEKKNGAIVIATYDTYCEASFSAGRPPCCCRRRGRKRCSKRPLPVCRQSCTGLDGRVRSMAPSIDNTHIRKIMTSRGQKRRE